MRNKAFRIPLMILFGVVVLIAGSYFTMILWNMLIPAIFHLTTITFYQALGLLILSRLLFGFHNGHRCSPRSPRHWHRNFDRLTPEEKEKLFHRTWDDDCCSPRGWGRGRSGDGCCDDKKDSEIK